MKIAVLGYSGAGKSTFAKLLSEHYGIPVLYLDTVNHLPKWEIRPREESCAIVGKFMDENESWVIDGDYSKIEQDRRLREADRIFEFLLPAAVCLKSAWQRYRTHRGTSRESMTESCEEKFDVSFFFWILFGGRKRNRKRRYRNIAIAYPEKTIIFRTRDEVNRYGERLKREGNSEKSV